LTTFIYIPISFAYVIPAKKAGIITPEQLAVPKKDFAVMGFLDCIAGIMQIFAATYLPGGLIILLLQSAIPVSMFLSYIILKERYHVTQYAAAIIVCGGIFLVLEPSILGGDDGGGSNTVLWAVVLILSCVPMCLSSIYKEVALGDTDLDPVYLNAWIAVFQFLFSVPLAVPSAIAGEPPVYPPDLPTNLFNGLKCYFGMSSIDCNDYGYVYGGGSVGHLFVCMLLLFIIFLNCWVLLTFLPDPS
jgi:drug/metabolite transporter (DMT)-like permease